VGAFYKALCLRFMKLLFQRGDAVPCPAFRPSAALALAKTAKALYRWNEV